MTDNNVIPHIDEIDTNRRDWAFRIDKVRMAGVVYRVERRIDKDEVLLVKDE